MSELRAGNAEEIGWNRERKHELLEVNGQVLTLDMSRVESIGMQMPRDITEGVNADNVMVRKLGDYSTLVLVVSVASDGLRWEAAT